MFYPPVFQGHDLGRKYYLYLTKLLSSQLPEDFTCPGGESAALEVRVNKPDATVKIKDVKTCSNQYPEPCFQKKNAEGSKLGHQELTTDDIQPFDTFHPKGLLQLKMGRSREGKEPAQIPLKGGAARPNAPTGTTCGY